jgi:hypothetical protein
MVPTDEILAVALIAVYLIDAVWLLGRDEAVVVLSGRGVQSVDLGSDWMLAGRRPVLLNPLLPFRVGFRAKWSLAAGENDASSFESATRVATALRPIGMLSTLAACCGVVGAPFALLTSNPLLFLWFWAGCILLVLTAGVFALARHQSLAVSRPWIAWYVIVGAVCIPLAGTFARSLAQRTTLRIALPEFAARHLPAARMAEFSEVFARILQGFLHEADEGSPRAQRLQAIIDDLRKVTS